MHSVHVYPYVVVIERRSVQLDELVASQHGTEWPPASPVNKRGEPPPG
jgi:hypothetical protein